MGLFSKKAVDANTETLFANPVRRDDLVSQARNSHKLAASSHPQNAASEQEVDLQESEDEEEEEESEIEDKYLRSKRDEEATQGSAPAEDAANDSGSDAEPETTDVHESKEDDMERTLFVKNVPYSVITDKKVFRAFRRLFEPDVKSLRFRSIAMSEMMPRKAAYIKQKLHPSRDAVNSYVVYKDADRVYDAMKELNGCEFSGHHIFVDHAAHPRKQDSKRSIFIGNLPFEASEEALYSHFQDCGTIENLRIVRDPQFNVGKGFAYVQFEDVSTIQLALLKNGQKFANRELRVTRCQAKATKNPNKSVQKPLYQRKAEPKKRRRRERVDESGMVLEGERAKVGQSGLSKKRRERVAGGRNATRSKKARHG